MWNVRVAKLMVMLCFVAWPAVAIGQEGAWVAFAARGGASFATNLLDGRVVSTDSDGRIRIHGISGNETSGMRFRYFGTPVTLADGRVLILGSCNLNYGPCNDPVGEFYDPITRQISAGPALPGPSGRHRPLAIRLADGRVLVAGGLTSLPLTDVNIWDPQSGWSDAAPMSVGRHEAEGTFAKSTLLLLNDGRVLATGAGLPSEIYDPSSNSWSPFGTGAEPPRSVAAKLHDGRLFFVGGLAGAPAAAIVDPETGSWSPAATPPASSGAATVLTDGRVLLVGGLEGNGLAFLYDPAVNAWQEAAALPFFSGSAGRVVAVHQAPDGAAVLFLDMGRAFFRQTRGPIAQVPDQSLTGFAGAFTQVTLLPSSIVDPDGDAIATVAWQKDDITLATGSPAAVMLGVGTHQLRLVMTDQTGSIGTASFTVSISDGLAAWSGELQACRADRDAAEAAVVPLHAEIAALHDANAALIADVTALQAEHAALETANTALQAGNAALQTETTALQNERALLAAQVGAVDGQVHHLEQMLGTLFKDSDFAIEGATPLAQITNLLEAIAALPDGPRKKLWKELGGVKDKKPRK